MPTKKTPASAKPAGARNARTRGPAAATTPATTAAKAAGKPTGANGHSLRATDPHQWIEGEDFPHTGEVELPELLIDEVIGQDEAVETAHKAARQGRHLLLLGDPGTGKSMIARAMAQILPQRELSDVLVEPNGKDAEQPTVRVLDGGTGREVVREQNKRAARRTIIYSVLEWVFAVTLVAGGVFAFFVFGGSSGLLIALIALLVAIFFLYVARQMGTKAKKLVPNLLIERPRGASTAPYIDATGSHAGALLGDVRHDPFQSGGLETPVHLRVEAGAIHRADRGLLFIDEINVLRAKSQQALLTAMQEKKYSITGQSEKSAGAMARTEPVPCEFILVAAGNLDVIAPSDGHASGLHPALRSRIRGYGYEVYVRNVMEDNDENRAKLVRFVAQEVRRDGQIPHFDRAAVAEVIREAQRRSGHTGKLTLRLRELGGLVRTAGDLARDDGRDLVAVDDVLRAKRMSMSLEYQFTHRTIQVTTSQEARSGEGSAVGTVVGCAFVGTGETGEPAGIVVPVEADATVSSDRQKGRIHLGGGLQDDPAVAGNTAAVLQRLRGQEMHGIDVHIQALLEQPGASTRALGAPAALAALSALEDLPARRDTVLIGALAVGGRLRAVEGVTQMVEGAADLGYARAVVPTANRGDVLLEHQYRDRIEVLFADDLAAAARHVLVAPPKRLAVVEQALRRGG